MRHGSCKDKRTQGPPRFPRDLCPLLLPLLTQSSRVVAMQKIRVFLNPKAAQSNAIRWEELIRKQLFRSELDFVLPRNTIELHEAIQQVISDKVDVVISVGGDGTFHTLIQKLAPYPIRFLVLPAGTANDLASELGLNRRLQSCLETLRRDEWKNIDLITINGIYMASNGGIGLVSDVANHINSLRERFPLFKSAMAGLKHQVYGLMVGYELISKKQEMYRLRVKAEGFDQILETPLLMINNQPIIAGNFLIAPDTHNSDGRFNVTIFTHKNFTDLVAAIYRVRCHIPPENDPHIISFETNHVVVERLDQPEAPLSFIGDGELLASARTLDIAIAPSQLKVYSHSLEHLRRRQA